MKRIKCFLGCALLSLCAAGCSAQSVATSTQDNAPEISAGDFPLGNSTGQSGHITPALYPTAETPGAINRLASLTPVVASAAPSVGCASCGGMTMRVSGASYPGYGSTFNGNYTFVRIGTDPKGCQFEAQSSGTWRWLLRPSSLYGGWELIGQQFSGVCVIYHTASDPSNGGAGWVGASFRLVFSSSGEGVPQSLSVN
jgi:hypothetical protein